MEATATTPERLDALRHLTLTEVEQRIADLDAERAALAVIRKAVAVRDRAKQRSARLAEGRAE
jgi:hypothetical protein